ncbi:MAG: N-6 DNA methylase, partial [Persicimonas sp.]
MKPRTANHLAALACQRLGLKGAERWRQSLQEGLSGLLEETVLTTWLERVEGPATAEDAAPIESVRNLMEPQARARDGVYFTPAPVAEAMAAAVDIRRGETVVDPAAGAGSLLAAVARRWPSARLVGVEKHPHLAIAAAIRIAAIRRQQGRDTPLDDRIYVGDGLARDERWARLEGRAGAVVANSPYVREKGRGEFFERLER